MKASTRLNILNSKKYLKKYTDRKYEPEGNVSFYLASYTKSVGYYLLKKIFNIQSKSFLYILSDIYFGINYSIDIIKKKILKILFLG